MDSLADLSYMHVPRLKPGGNRSGGSIYASFHYLRARDSLVLSPFISAEKRGCLGVQRGRIGVGRWFEVEAETHYNDYKRVGVLYCRDKIDEIRPIRSIAVPRSVIAGIAHAHNLIILHPRLIYERATHQITALISF